MLNIDLHTHSTCSDGALTPAELIGRAAAAGVQVLALTDHDTIAGLDEAQRGAAANAIRLVPGVEISAAWRAQAKTGRGAIQPAVEGTGLDLQRLRGGSEV